MTDSHFPSSFFFFSTFSFNILSALAFVGYLLPQPRFIHILFRNWKFIDTLVWSIHSSCTWQPAVCRWTMYAACFYGATRIKCNNNGNKMCAENGAYIRMYGLEEECERFWRDGHTKADRNQNETRAHIRLWIRWVNFKIRKSNKWNEGRSVYLAFILFWTAFRCCVNFLYFSEYIRSELTNCLRRQSI